MISKIELEELLEELEKIRGSHTELISVYIPSGQNINVVAKQIEEEKGTASNIKSKTTRKNVIDALESISRELKKYKKTPENGLVIFCGNVSEKEGQQDIKLWVLEPPEPLKVRLYRCDKEFVLEPLKEMLEVKEVYGLVVMDRKEATLGLLEGKQIKVLRKLTSGVPGKVRAGGQSSQRFHRITEGLTKEDFMKEGQLVAKLKEKVLGLKDIGNTDESGLTDLVEESKDLLEKQEIIHEKKLLEKFFELLGKGKKAVYKKRDVEKALKYGAVETLILSKKIEKKVKEELAKKAENISAEVEIVSDETEEGIS